DLDRREGRHEGTSERQVRRHPRPLTNDGDLACVRAMRESDDREEDRRRDVPLERVRRTGERRTEPEIVHRGVWLAIRRERQKAALHSANAHRRRTTVTIERNAVITLSRHHGVAIDAARQAYRIEVDDDRDEGDECADGDSERGEARHRLPEPGGWARRVTLRRTRDSEEKGEPEADVDERSANQEQLQPYEGHEEQAGENDAGDGAEGIEPVHRPDGALATHAAAAVHEHLRN